MSFTLILEQSLNGLQLGLMLFLIAAGLTLIFGIMDMVNLAHGSLYMIGAYLAATVAQASGSFMLGMAAAVAGTALFGALLELTLFRRLYERDHLAQVLGTFAILLMCNEGVRIVWGPQPLPLDPPPLLAGPVELFAGMQYPAYRLFVIVIGLSVAAGLYLLITHTRIGMHVRAGASNRAMAQVMGVDVRKVFTLVFALGAALCAVAGSMLGPLVAVQIGMGDSVLILAFVVVVIGGIGSIRGALIGALLVGTVDTVGRSFLPAFLATMLPPAAAAGIGTSIATMLIYMLMAAVLVWKPEGLFPARA
jgi:branched-chain amino acid transport system permease protein